MSLDYILGVEEVAELDRISELATQEESGSLIADGVVGKATNRLASVLLVLLSHTLFVKEMIAGLREVLGSERNDGRLVTRPSRCQCAVQQAA